MGGGFEELEFNLVAPDPIAVEVRGESMLPVYRPGDYLICSRRRGADLQEALNKDCVVRTSENEGYIKKLVQGSRANTYTLVSYNAAPIENQKLLWAAPIVWVKRA